MESWPDGCTRLRGRSAHRCIRLALGCLALLAGALGCDDESNPTSPETPAPTLEVRSPDVMVQADEVAVEVEVTEGEGRVDGIRYSVRMAQVDGPAGTVATGDMHSVDGRTYRAGVTLDAEGLYKIRLTALRSDAPVAEAERDFKYGLVPAPAPILPELPESPAQVEIVASPSVYPLVVDTEPGVRIEVSRGEVLLGRATATTDRVEVDIEIEAGENPLVVRAWRRQASAETAVVIDARVTKGKPPPPPPTVESLCDKGRFDAAWRGRGRLASDPSGSPALADCLVRGAARAEAWPQVVDLVAQATEAGTELSLSALVLGAEANARTRRAEARDGLWRRVVDTISESSGATLVDAEAAARIGGRIRESGAGDDVLLSCVDHRDPKHPCGALVSAARPDPSPPEPEADPPEPEADPPEPETNPPEPPTPTDPWPPIANACAARSYAEAGRLYAALPDRGAHPPSRPERLCLALGLRLAGDCRLAVETAGPLAEQVVYETVPGLQIVAGCQATLGERDAAAESWRRAIELALAGKSSFLVAPDRVRRDLDGSELSEAQRAKAVEPCAGRAEHTLCDALVDAPEVPTESVATLCRSRRYEEAARHPEAGDADPELAPCIARGHIRAGHPQQARQQLRAALGRLEPGAALGEVARLLATVSERKEQIDAMRRAVEMVAQELYVVGDEATFYREIEGVQGKKGPALQTILAPCREARRREACQRLLAHFDEPAAPSPPTARHVAPDPDPEPPPTHPKPPSKDPDPGDERAPDVVVRPAGARLSLRLDAGTVERDTPSGALSFDKDSLSPGAHRFTLTAKGAEARRGTINLGRRSEKQGPVRLYAHRSAAHADFSAGITALGKGDLAAAIDAFTKATRADADFCMAWTYLGYAQGLSGKAKVAAGSFSRCSSSLGNDLEAVVAARVLHRVVDLRAAIDGPPDRIRSLVDRLAGVYGDLQYLVRVLPGSRRSPVKLGDVHKYWLAQGYTALWRKLTDAGSGDAEAACKEALAAWRALRPGMRIEGRSIVDTRTDFATERQQALTALGAACK